MESLDRLIVDEIALEGLEGITIEALFCRLKNVPNFPLNNVDDPLVREYIWKNIICNERLLTHRYIEMYKLPQPREEFIYYNRYDSLDPIHGCPKESDDMPADIFPDLHPVSKDGVMGSCKLFERRTDITEEFLTYQQLPSVQEKYGDTLVIVASQELRNESLGINSIDASLNIHVATYCYLEKVGRSRRLGLPSVGKEALRMDAGTLFYYRKKLRKEKLLSTTTYSYVNTSGLLNIGRISYLNRFYPCNRLPSATQTMAARVSEFLSHQENQECDWPIVLEQLNGYNKKQINNMLAEFQKHFRLIVKEMKDSRYTKKRITLMKPVVLDDTVACLADDDEDDDVTIVNDTIKSEMNEDVLDDRVRAYDPSVILVDRCLLSQVLTFIERAHGVTESGLADKFCLTKLDARSLLRSLARRSCVQTVKDVQGKTKVNKFVPLHKVGDANAIFDSLSRGLSHDTKNDTITYLNRANYILNLIESSADKIYLGLGALAKQIQEAEGSSTMVDRRTIMRIINRLESEGKLKRYSTEIPIKNRIISLTAICDPSIDEKDAILLDKIARYRHNGGSPRKELDADATTVDTNTDADARTSKRSKKSTTPRGRGSIAGANKRLRLSNVTETIQETGNGAGDESTASVIPSIDLTLNESNPIDITLDSEPVYIFDVTPTITSTTTVASIIPATMVLSSTPITQIASASRKRYRLFDESSQHIILQSEPAPPKEKKQRQKRKKDYYDAADREAMSNLMTIRCRWSHSEDRFLKFCRVASLLLDPKCNTNMCIQSRVLRDELQKLVPMSQDKTAKACQRRVAYLLKNAATRRQISDLVSEFRQSDVLCNVKRPREPKTQEDIWTKAFLETLYKVLDKFSSSNVGTQDNIDFDSINLNEYHLVDPISSEKENKPAFYSPHDINEISCNCISNVILSSLLINKFTDIDTCSSRLYEIYAKYPDSLIRLVVNRFKSKQILAGIKKILNLNESESFVSKKTMPFKISAAFDLLLQTKLTMDTLIRSIELIDQSIIRKEIHDRSDACYATCLFAGRKINFSLTIPGDHITLNDKHLTKPTVTGRSRDGKTSKSVNTTPTTERNKSSRSFLYALRKQMELQTSGHNKQDKLSDLLVLNNCPVDTHINENIRINELFYQKLDNLCSSVIHVQESDINAAGKFSTRSIEGKLVRFVEEKREFGATIPQIISHLGNWPRTQVEQLITRKILFRLGVDTFHLVHVKFIDHWLVESTNEKGEKIKFIPKVWFNCSGQPVKVIIYQLMAALVGHIAINPGVTVNNLLNHFGIAAPATQLMEMLDLLQCADCISMCHLQPTCKPKLFSQSMQVDSINLQNANIGQDLLNEQLLCEATPEAFVKLGLLRYLLTTGESDATRREVNE